MNLFNLSNDDFSIQFLGQIFGTVGTLLPSTTPSPVMLSMLFGYMNAVALTLAIFIIIYTTVITLVNTASEGEFLGRKYNFWTVVRIVIGTICVFPINHGYSLLQVAMMWVIIQGIGVADTLWNNLLGVYETTGSIYGGLKVDRNTLNSQFTNLYTDLVCQASAKRSYAGIQFNSLVSDTDYSGSTTTQWYCADYPDDPFCVRSPDQMLNILGSGAGQSGPQANGAMAFRYSMGPYANQQGTGGACGIMAYCDESVMCNVHDANKNLILDQYGSPQPDPNGLDCLVCQAQKDTLSTQIIPTLATAAEAFVDLDYAYINWMNTVPVTYTHPTPNGQTMTEMLYPNLVTPDWIQSICTQQHILSTSCTPSGQFSNYLPYTDTKTTNTSSDAAQNIYALGLKPYGNFIDTAIGQYTSAIEGAYTNWLSQQVQVTHSSDAWVNDATAAGWIEAGMFYYELAKVNKDNAQSLSAPFAVTTPDSSAVVIANGYRNNVDAVGDLLAGVKQANQANSPPSNSAAMPKIAKPVSDLVAGSAGTLLDTFITTMSSGTCVADNCSGSQYTNPLVSIANYGYAMMVTAQVLFATILVAVFAIITVLTITVIGLGVGPPVNPIGEGAKALLNFSTILIALLLSWMYGLGATLGIYVPLIPYILFTMGGVGWMVTTIEAIAAAPIIGLGIMMPSGQHEVLGKAEAGLMMLLNLFLRPGLMIIGLIAAMYVALPAVLLLNNGFVWLVQTIIQAPGLFEELLFMSAYTSLLISILNKVFSLIFIVPERILTWIGGQSIQYGEAEAVSAAKHAVEGAAGATTGLAKATGGAFVSGAINIADKKIEEKKDQMEATALALKKAEKAVEKAEAGSDAEEAAEEAARQEKAGGGEAKEAKGEGPVVPAVAEAAHAAGEPGAGGGAVPAVPAAPALAGGDVAAPASAAVGNAADAGAAAAAAAGAGAGAGGAAAGAGASKPAKPEAKAEEPAEEEEEEPEQEQQAAPKKKGSKGGSGPFSDQGGLGYWNGSGGGAWDGEDSGDFGSSNKSGPW